MNKLNNSSDDLPLTDEPQYFTKMLSSNSHLSEDGKSNERQSNLQGDWEQISDILLSASYSKSLLLDPNSANISRSSTAKQNKEFIENVLNFDGVQYNSEALGKNKQIPFDSKLFTPSGRITVQHTTLNATQNHNGNSAVHHSALQFDPLNYNHAEDTEVETLTLNESNIFRESPLFIRNKFTGRFAKDRWINSIKTLKQNNCLASTSNANSAVQSFEQPAITEEGLQFSQQDSKRNENGIRCGRPKFVPEVMEDFYSTPSNAPQWGNADAVVINNSQKKLEEKAKQPDTRGKLSSMFMMLGTRSKAIADSPKEGNQPLPLQVEDLRCKDPSATTNMFQRRPSSDLVQMQLREISESNLEDQPDIKIEEKDAAAEAEEEGIAPLRTLVVQENVNRAQWMKFLPDHVRHMPLQRLFIPGERALSKTFMKLVPDLAKHVDAITASNGVWRAADHRDHRLYCLATPVNTSATPAIPENTSATPANTPATPATPAAPANTSATPTTPANTSATPATPATPAKTSATPANTSTTSPMLLEVMVHCPVPVREPSAAGTRAISCRYVSHQLPVREPSAAGTRPISCRYASHQLPVRELSAAGSHDSCTANLRWGDLGPDVSQSVRRLSAVAPCIAKSAFMRWSVTQRTQLTQQLSNGVRYFDLRVMEREGRFYFVHGLFGDDMQIVLEEISSFLWTQPSEVVLLDFQHLYEFSPAHHRGLVATIEQAFRGALCPVMPLHNLTLHQLNQNHYQVLVFYRSDAVNNFEQNFLWTGFVIPNPWPRTTNVDEMLEFLAAQLDDRNPDIFHVTHCRKTAVGENCEETVVGENCGETAVGIVVGENCEETALGDNWGETAVGKQLWGTNREETAVGDNCGKTAVGKQQLGNSCGEQLWGTAVESQLLETNRVVVMKVWHFQEFYQLCVLTPSTSAFMLRNLCSTLEAKMALPANRAVLDHLPLLADRKGGCNVVMVDFVDFEDYAVPRAVIQLNFSHYDLPHEQ
ncbi:PLC-like phosphodiesterase TIM beta/alpha-barrel domain [Trinorchestia longiramus]|nr:PLC-like phosphodiesterase TIM beta/alpha-barrel domain [Trinorchestia longiramus]